MTRSPLPQYEVAGATKKFKVTDPDDPCSCVPDSIWNDPNIIVEEKKDGHRFRAHITAEGNRFDSRRPSVHDGLYVEKTDNAPHLRDFALPHLIGTVFDGELCSGKDSNSVAHALGSHATPEEKASIHYVVYDILFHNGEDMRNKPDRERRLLLSLLFNDDRLGKSTHIRLISRPPMIPEHKRAILIEAMANAEEGIMMKDTSKPYYQGWIKVKREARFDVVVMGYDAPAATSKKKGDAEETITKYAANGWIGAIKFGQVCADGILREMGKTSGMDDAFRQEVSENKEKFIGTVIEIAAQERFAKTGKFRHPRFIRVRDDKPASECIYHEDEI